MSKLLNLLFRWAAAFLAVYWVLLFISTHTPASALPSEPPFPFADKVVHVVGYAGLAFMAAATWTWRRTLFLRDYVVLFFAVSCYGVVDEALQMLPGIRRNADVVDWAADTLGAGLGLCAFALAAACARRRGLRLARAQAASDSGLAAQVSAKP